MKLFGNISRERKTFFLLLCCIICFVTGLAVLTVGALAHVNPNENFAGLFRWDKLMNLVYSVVPDIR